MPQDIPIEASETLAFTPECLASIDGAPQFMLRAATPRDKRRQRRLLIEEGLRTHTLARIRDEVIAGLKALWTPEAFEAHAPLIRGYWEAQDEFAKQKAHDPEIVWTHDKDVEDAIVELTQRVAKSWPPLARMMADNDEFEEVQQIVSAAIMIKSWGGLATPRALDSGYLTVDCASGLKDDLEKFAEAHRDEIEKATKDSFKPGLAWLQLFIACAKRMYLDEEELGNSGSPSPSGTPPQASSEIITSGSGGKSPASARSKKTPVTA